MFRCDRTPPRPASSTLSPLLLPRPFPSRAQLRPRAFQARFFNSFAAIAPTPVSFAGSAATTRLLGLLLQLFRRYCSHVHCHRGSRCDRTPSRLASLTLSPLLLPRPLPSRVPLRPHAFQARFPNSFAHSFRGSRCDHTPPRPASSTLSPLLLPRPFPSQVPLRPRAFQLASLTLSPLLLPRPLPSRVPLRPRGLLHGSADEVQA